MTVCLKLETHHKLSIKKLKTKTDHMLSHMILDVFLAMIIK